MAIGLTGDEVFELLDVDGVDIAEDAKQLIADVIELNNKKLEDDVEYLIKLALRKL